MDDLTKTFLISGAMCLFCLYMLKQAVRGRRLAAESTSWPSVPGKIKDASVSQRTGGYSISNFSVTYAYMVADKSHLGRHVAFYTLLHDDQRADIIANCTEGATVDVYVNPDNPSDAVLIPGPSPDGKQHSGIAIAITALVAVIGGTIVVLMNS